VQDDSADDLAAFGAPAEMIDAATPDPGAELFGVWEENAGVVVMFMRMQTQWNVTNGAFLGLHYPSAEFLIKIHGVEDASAMMDDLQAMELAALQVLNKRKE
jgi:hypothetical protein